MNWHLNVLIFRNIAQMVIKFYFANLKLYERKPKQNFCNSCLVQKNIKQGSDIEW